ncbi:MAG: hypothetical protein ABSH06_30610 [Thermodesulfobacteriota bacterium]|jgi:hypothetical protein
MMKKRAVEEKSPIAKARANVIKFCEIMDSFPIDFRFKLTDTGKGLDGTWRKRTFNGATAWQNGSQLLFNSSFYPFRKTVFGAIEEAGYPVRQLYFPDKRGKIVSPLTKEKVEELYCAQKKSLQDIAKEYGCTKQWIMLLMEKYGLKRRTRSEATKEAINQGKR